MVKMVVITVALTFHRVLFVDGIWLAERLVVLICCSEDRVVSWYMAQSENSRAWSALMEAIPAPDDVVADGGGGSDHQLE